MKSVKTFTRVVMLADHVRSLERNIFKRWRSYTVHKLRSRKNRSEADNLYQRNLKKRVFRALAKNAHYVTLSKYFRLWLKYTKIKSNGRACAVGRKLRKPLENRLRTKTKLEISVLHHKHALLKRYFAGWEEFCNMKIRERELCEIALKHYSRCLLTRYMKHLRRYVSKMNDKRETLRKVEIFYSKKLINRTFLNWRNYTYKKSITAEKIYCFREKLELRIKRKLYYHWRLYVYRKKCNRRKIFLLSNIHKKRLMRNSLQKWRDYVLYRRKKMARMETLNGRVTAIISYIQAIYIEKWRAALSIVMREKRQTFQASEFWNFRLTHKYFSLWKEYSQAYKIRAKRKKKLNEMAMNILLGHYLSIWRDRCHEVMKTRQKEEQVLALNNNKRQRKYFDHWRKYIEYRRKKKDELKAAKEVHRQFLLRDGLRDILRNSLWSVERRYEIQLQNMTLKLHHDFEIMKKYFNKWFHVVYAGNKSTESLIMRRSPDHLPLPSYLRLPEYMQKSNYSSAEKENFPLQTDVFRKDIPNRGLNLSRSFMKPTMGTQAFSDFRLKNNRKYFIESSTNSRFQLDQPESGVSSLNTSNFHSDPPCTYDIEENDCWSTKSTVNLMPPSAFYQ